MRVLVLTLALAAGVFCPPRLYGQSLGSQFPVPPQTRASGSYLGVRMMDVTPEIARNLKLDSERGVHVNEVLNGSPAEKAGIKPGDVLLSYNGETILGAEQFVRLVRETPPGRKVKIQYWRDGKTETATVATGTPPEPRLELPPTFRSFDPHAFRNFFMPTDIPTPLLVWKNSALGIECEPVDSQLAQYFGVKRGVLIRAVEKNSPGDKAGIRSGDVVTAIDGHEVSNPRDITASVRNQAAPGKPVQVSVVRDHKSLVVSVVPAEIPEGRQPFWGNQ
ncbi:MAG: PDZ domain-containing protein [Acidobacteriaceae bacterium]|nr:PDZ domain-containing protein [Acidobacteriaceae bacterium]